MQSLSQQPTVLTEALRPRPALETLACVPPACQRCRLTGQDPLTVRPVYGPAPRRRRRCRTGGAACSERRGTALFHTKVAAAPAASGLKPRGAGGGGRAPARGGHVSTDTGARLLHRAGRHAERCHEPRGHDRPPQALAGDTQGSGVKKSRSVAGERNAPRRGPWGPLGRLRPLAHGACRTGSANGRKSRRAPWGTRPRGGGVQGSGRRSVPMPMRARRRRSWTPWAIAIVPPGPAKGARSRGRSCAGPQDGRMGRCKNPLKGVGASGWPCRSCPAKRVGSRSCLCEATKLFIRVWWSVITGPGACAISARCARRWLFPKRRGRTAG